jgi:hypothetical protein
MDVNPPMPGGVALLVERMAGDLASLAADAEVTARHVRDQRWRVTATNPRVTMWVEFEPLQRRRLKWRGSELWIDGVQVERREYDDVLRTFADPDDTGKEPVSVDVPLASAPDPVMKLIRTVARAGAKMRLTPSIRRSGNEYAVSFTSDRVRMTMHAREHFNFMRPAQPDRGDLAEDVELWIDGVDHSAAAGRTLAGALREASAHLAAPAPPSVAAEHREAVNTGVQVRKTTVIRN